MSTQLVYGSFAHPIDECRVSILPSINWPGDGPMRIRTQWTVYGEIIVPANLNLTPTQSTNYLTQALLVRQQVYAQSGLNLVYFAPTGVVAQQILWKATYDGIHFEPPQIDPQDGEWANSLKYKMTARAEVFAVAPPAGLVSYNESWTLGGGGPIIAWSEPITDTPKSIQIRQQTTFKAQQTIHAVARADYPFDIVKPRAFSYPPLSSAPEYTKERPYLCGSYINFPLSMKANYESSAPLNFSPNLVF